LKSKLDPQKETCVEIKSTEQTSNKPHSFKNPKRCSKNKRKPYNKKAKKGTKEKQVRFNIGKERIQKMMFGCATVVRKQSLVHARQIAKSAHQTQIKLTKCKEFTVPLKQRSRLWDRGKVKDPLHRSNKDGHKVHDPLHRSKSRQTTQGMTYRIRFNYCSIHRKLFLSTPPYYNKSYDLKRCNCQQRFIGRDNKVNLQDFQCSQSGLKNKL